MGRGATAQSEAVVEKERNKKKKKEMKKTYIIPEEKVVDLGLDGQLLSDSGKGGSNYASGGSGSGSTPGGDGDGMDEDNPVKAQGLWNQNW